jgi:hypothetical protein
MTITVAHVTPLVALIAGILILIVPRLLNYVVAVYLIIVGLVGLNGIYHFISDPPPPSRPSAPLRRCPRR